jgi:AraC-like DNA-binding protein
LERLDTILLDPITARAFREFVTTALLLHQPQNYTEILCRLARPVTPRDVKRAIDYIEANLDAAIGLSEIVAASGDPGRTLIQHFRDFKRTTPTRYLRSARYEKVREALQHAEPEESITEIATRWGFSHLGRFSVDYDIATRTQCAGSINGAESPRLERVGVATNQLEVSRELPRAAFDPRPD